MKNILRPQYRSVLRRLLETRPILVFDYDGTLSPIALRPTQATLPASTAQLLVRLCRSHRCALLTGRARADIVGKVATVPFVEVIGNHGAEWIPPLGSYRAERALVTRWMKTLERELGNIVGLQLENKGLTLSVHLRNVSNRRFIPAITVAVHSLSGARIITGKKVFNLVPKRLPNKGSAVLQLMRRYRAMGALYLGDDATDEDVFRLCNPRILGVHIGSRGESAAPFFIPRQAQVDRLIRELLWATKGNEMGL